MLVSNSPRINPFTMGDSTKLHTQEGGWDSHPSVFEKIKETAENTVLWGKLLKRAFSNSHSQCLLTACWANFRLLNLCFLGEKRANEVFKKLNGDLTVNIPLDMLNKEMNNLVKEKVLFHNIITGNEMFELKKGVKKYSSKFLDDNLESSLNNVPNFIIPKIQQMYLESVSERSIFNYNHPTINALESEINDNISKVNENCSFLYHVCIDVPGSPQIAQKGSQSEVYDSKILYGHAFILEQYYSPKENKDLIYLHQAWINKLTLADNYARMGGNKDAASMDSEKVGNFFHNLRGLLSSGKNPEFNSLDVCQKACFGVSGGSENVNPIIFFRWEDKIFSGVAIRYATSMIDPNECRGHIDDVIKKYSKRQIVKSATC